ncbi:MAG TPA: FxsA family protein [Longimicrobiaceae bacterium]|nr:FxsA family protein [Longimicrobiaceae bacterium]
MLAKLLLLFVLVPLVEMAILVRLGTLIGFWPTIGLVVATGAVGALLAKSQGMRVLRAIRTEMAAGRVPASELIDGLLVLVGGIVLLTPGLLTDVLGLVLLIPATRGALKAGVRRRLEGMVQSGEMRVMRF